MADALPALHDTGGGDAVLFLHAFPLDASQWDHQVAALSGEYRCIRPDYWGCGASPQPPPGAPALDDYAGDVLRALDAGGIDTFTVVGCSLGGYVAFALLRLASQRVSALVLANTRASADSDTAGEDRRALASRLEDADSVEMLVDANVQRLLGPDAREEVHITDPLRGRIRRWTPQGAAHALRAMAGRPDSTGTLAAVRVPVLVIAGRDDAVIPFADVQAMQDAAPSAIIATLPCGHLSNLEDPPAFTAQVRQFLRTSAAVSA